MTGMRNHPDSISTRIGLAVAALRDGVRRRFGPGDDARSLLAAFVATIAAPGAEGSLGQRLLRALVDAAASESGAIWARNPTTGAFLPMASVGMAGPLSHVSAQADLSRFLAETGRIVEIGECGWDHEDADGPILPPWMRGFGEGWVVVPLIHQGGTEGFAMLCLAPSQSVEGMMALATLAASYLAEARVSQELSDVRSLSDYSRRSAFIRHDVKNVLGQMSLMLQNAERFGDDPLFQRDMLMTVGAAVARLRAMQSRLDRGGRSLSPRRFNLVDIAAAAAAGWRPGRAAIFSAESPVVMVLGQADRMASVLGHLIGNAWDAAGPDGTVRVAVGADGVVEIADSGPGMSADFIRDRLFRPLQTSKPGGSGIGAFQAAWLVREMNGCLDVESELGRGTLVRIRLPTRPGVVRRGIRRDGSAERFGLSV